MEEHPCRIYFIASRSQTKPQNSIHCSAGRLCPSCFAPVVVLRAAHKPREALCKSPGGEAALSGLMVGAQWPLPSGFSGWAIDCAPQDLGVAHWLGENLRMSQGLVIMLCQNQVFFFGRNPLPKAMASFVCSEAPNFWPTMAPNHQHRVVGV